MSEFYLENRIYYHDTDSGGVVYYASYLEHLEEARTEYLRSIGIDIAGYAAKGILFPVVHLEIDYKCPARYGDLIRIVTKTESVGNASVHFAQEVKNGDTVLLRSKTVWACVDNNMKARRIPDEIKQKLSVDEK